MTTMHVSAKGDYAARAVTALAARYPDRASAQALADAHDLPRKFLEAVLADLKRAAIVSSTRGADGGYALRRPPAEITLGEVLRAIDGPLADVHGLRPDEVTYPDAFQHLQEVWVAARASVRLVFDEVTLDQLVSGEFHEDVLRMLAITDAWDPRTGPQAPRTR
ncbi:Rrf2 family transcriptional regulator [Demequina sp. NBRC 110057]|uniref:RrF2 family transcriptional regulator n=1 Tax=Demequina sp. NBRC 110057 TaxID=1570346 RepID=UPI0027D77D81|nr:Rrf2 family transcriptional regulator [Demequina sp. NBRC 110057]